MFVYYENLSFWCSSFYAKNLFFDILLNPSGCWHMLLVFLGARIRWVSTRSNQDISILRDFDKFYIFRWRVSIVVYLSFGLFWELTRHYEFFNISGWLELFFRWHIFFKFLENFYCIIFHSVKKSIFYMPKKYWKINFS